MMIELVQMTDFRRPQGQDAAVLPGPEGGSGDFLAVMRGADAPAPVAVVLPEVRTAGPATDVLPAVSPPVPILSEGADVAWGLDFHPGRIDPPSHRADADPKVGEVADPGFVPTMMVAAPLPAGIPPEATFPATMPAAQTIGFASPGSPPALTEQPVVLPARPSGAEQPGSGPSPQADLPQKDLQQETVAPFFGPKTGTWPDQGTGPDPDKTPDRPLPDPQPPSRVGANARPAAPIDPAPPMDPAARISDPGLTRLPDGETQRQEPWPGVALGIKDRPVPVSPPDRQGMAPQTPRAPDTLPDRQETTPPLHPVPDTPPDLQGMTPLLPEPDRLSPRQGMAPLLAVPDRLPARQGVAPPHPAVQTLPDREGVTPHPVQAPPPDPQGVTLPLPPVPGLAPPSAEQPTQGAVAALVHAHLPVTVSQGLVTEGRRFPIPPPREPGPPSPGARLDASDRSTGPANLLDPRPSNDLTNDGAVAGETLIVVTEQIAPDRHQVPSRQAAYDFRLADLGPPTLGVQPGAKVTAPVQAAFTLALPDSAPQDKGATPPDLVTPPDPVMPTDEADDAAQTLGQPTAAVQANGLPAQIPAIAAPLAAISPGQIAGLADTDPSAPGPALFDRAEPPPVGQNAVPSRPGDPVTTQVAHLIVHRAEDRAEVLLEPAELGRMRFEITHRGDGVQILLSAERPETLELLRRHADQLTGEFRAMGFGSADLGFGTWGGGQAKPDRTAWTDLGPAPVINPGGIAPAPVTRALTTGSGGLDLRL